MCSDSVGCRVEKNTCEFQPCTHTGTTNHVNILRGVASCSHIPLMDCGAHSPWRTIGIQCCGLLCVTLLTDVRGAQFVSCVCVPTRLCRFQSIDEGICYVGCAANNNLSMSCDRVPSLGLKKGFTWLHPTMCVHTDFTYTVLEAAPDFHHPCADSACGSCAHSRKVKKIVPDYCEMFCRFNIPSTSCHARGAKHQIPYIAVMKVPRKS